MAVYSHVRRKALIEAAQALEPDKPDTMSSAVANQSEASAEEVTSQTTSQSAPTRTNVLEFPKKVGSSGWTRTSNPPVNSRMLCH
jgi:hypothetical protein